MSSPASPFEQLLRGLDDPDRHARCRAARGLGEGRDPRAVDPLLRALRDPAGDVRASAAVALGRLRDERAIGPLIAAIGDAKVSVRSGASAAARKFGKRAYRPLVDAFRGASGESRASLLDVLALHNTAEVFDLLVDAFRGASGESRASLVAALARFKTPAASDFLISALDDPDGHVHLAVVHLLGRRKDRRAVERLLGALAEARAKIADAARARDDAARESTVSAGRPGDAMAEWSAVAIRLDCYARALGEIGDERAFGPLQELLEAERADEWIGPAMMEVVRALRTIDNARAVDLLHRLLDDPSHPGRDRLEMTLAGMDLMGAVRSLVARAAGGDVGAIREGLRATLASQEELHARGSGIGGPPADEGAIGRTGTDLMRQLEEALRELGRGRPGARPTRGPARMIVAAGSRRPPLARAWAGRSDPSTPRPRRPSAGGRGRRPSPDRPGWDGGFRFRGKQKTTYFGAFPPLFA